MPRPGFAFSTAFRVRYAEIDGQKVVFNSRYLEYADVAATDYWEWTGAEATLGTAWTETEFHVRRSEIDYLKPFVWGDTVDVSVRIDRIGNSSLIQRFELANGAGDLCATIDMVVVNVHLPTGRPMPLADAVRAFLATLVEQQQA
ncbi:acyl-CoA thioesterase [Sphingomonas sp.]|uniref:acyl-CoA thioesterase n=1 Tax=Sphingomonas sp. TaxID=28214 RepID=UPI002DD64B28|nr:thioesterase family protein [Sphingomonas sp.]